VAALTPRVVRTARGRVEVADTGAGPTLLVVHGMPGDWRQARTVAEDLAGQARVLLVSRPGYGRTPLSSGRSPQEQAALYRALLDALQVPRAVVLGISGGGPSSYAFAAQHADRCAALVLCCPVRGGLLEVPAGMRRLAAVPGVWSAVAGGVRAADAVLRAAGRPPRTAVSSFTAVEQQRLTQPRVLAALHSFEADRTRTLRGRGLRNDTLQFDVPPPSWPRGVQVPTVVMHGDLDDIVPVSHAHDYAAVVPGARLEVLAGLGHAVPLFAREAVAEVLGELLSRPAAG
jgi:pimeloyl-ACP methyl ester carboxylesterase